MRGHNSTATASKRDSCSGSSVNSCCIFVACTTANCKDCELSGAGSCDTCMDGFAKVDEDGDGNYECVGTWQITCS